MTHRVAPGTHTECRPTRTRSAIATATASEGVASGAVGAEKNASRPASMEPVDVVGAALEPRACSPATGDSARSPRAPAGARAGRVRFRRVCPRRHSTCPGAATPRERHVAGRRPRQPGAHHPLRLHHLANRSSPSRGAAHTDHRGGVEGMPSGGGQPRPGTLLNPAEVPRRPKDHSRGDARSGRRTALVDGWGGWGHGCRTGATGTETTPRRLPTVASSLHCDRTVSVPRPCAEHPGWRRNKARDRSNRAHRTALADSGAECGRRDTAPDDTDGCPTWVHAEHEMRTAWPVSTPR